MMNIILKKVKFDLSHIIKHTTGLTETKLIKNDILLDSIMFRLIQISENCDKLTETFRLKNSNIPWWTLKGLKNRIVHDYGEVDLSIIFNTVKNNIPYLLNELNSL